MIALILTVLVVYPVYAFVAVLVLIQFLPGGWSPSAKDQVLNAFGTATLSKRNIDDSNRTTDGSYLFSFTVTSTDITGGSYIAGVRAGQPLKFVTYQTPLRGNVNLKDCNELPLARKDGAGTLTLTTTTSDYSHVKVVPLSGQSLKQFDRITEADWKAAGADEDSEAPYNLIVEFTPSSFLVGQAKDCAGYSVFVILTYTKPLLTAGAAP